MPAAALRIRTTMKSTTITATHLKAAASVAVQALNAKDLTKADVVARGDDGDAGVVVARKRMQRDGPGSRVRSVDHGRRRGMQVATNRPMIPMTMNLGWTIHWVRWGMMKATPRKLLRALAVTGRRFNVRFRRGMKRLGSSSTRICSHVRNGRVRREAVSAAVGEGEVAGGEKTKAPCARVKRCM
jgi:hypothetical protein